MLKPIQKTSLASSVFEQVRDLILTGAYQPGDSLPAERQLAETLGVNRSAIREALKRLEQAGLIAIHHGGNTRVLDYRHHASPAILQALVRLEPSRAADLQVFRTAVLPEVCRAAAQSARADQISRLEMLAGLMRNGDDAQYADLIAEYWSVMVDASTNIVFRLVFNSLAAIPPGHRAPTADEVFDLTNAVAAGDIRGAGLAAKAMLT